MWQNIRPYLISLSIALNLSFLAMWIAYAAPVDSAGEVAGEEGSPRTAESSVWCPLHRELQVTEQQWREIEPRLRQFQASVGELSAHVDRMRSEVIDLLAAESPDLAAVRAKQDEILAAKRAMQDMVAAHLIAERQVLTAAQQQQLFQRLRDRTRCSAEGPPMSGRGQARKRAVTK
jgi:Spy/CpxP family protein refolding chaperone